MRKLLLIGILFCLVFTRPLAVLGEVQPGNPRIDIPKETWNFGKVKEGKILKHTFIIKNVGSTELELNAYPGCRTCISPELSQNNIPPKGKADLHITLYTTGKSGEIEAYTMIQSNDPKQPVKKITVKAFVIGKQVK